MRALARIRARNEQRLLKHIERLMKRLAVTTPDEN
jgi:hypothetical protein